MVIDTLLDFVSLIEGREISLQNSPSSKVLKIGKHILGKHRTEKLSEFNLIYKQKFFKVLFSIQNSRFITRPILLHFFHWSNLLRPRFHMYFRILFVFLCYF